MKYKLSKLENGLRVICVPIPNMASATITIWVGVGSRYEQAKINGISHFLEHMVFKGSRKRPSAKKIAEAIDAFGGEFNASTSKEWTNFYIKSRKEKLDIAFDVLSDMVLNPILKTEDIEREKGVIIEEIGMYEDTPLMKIDDIFENLIFSGNELGWDIAGVPKTVRATKKSDFERYRSMHYGSNNIVVTVAGGISEDSAHALSEKYLSELENKKKRKESNFIPKQKKPQVKLREKKAEQAHFMLGFLGYPRGHKDRFTEAVLTTILGGGMSSRLFIEVREKRGLAYAVKTSSDHYIDTGYLATYAGVDIKRIEEAVKVTLDEHYKIGGAKGKISAKELKKAKEYLKGHIALNLEDTNNINSFFGIRELMLGKLETPDDVYRGIDAVSIEDVYSFAKKMFAPEKLNLAIIGPYEDRGRFERLLK